MKETDNDTRSEIPNTKERKSKKPSAKTANKRQTRQTATK